LIYDCLIGDSMLFQRADQVESTWRVVEPVLRGWESVTPRHFPNYAAGSTGPIAANDLLARDGRSWRAIK
jgi:glucose-6-phosphate 1-dehydrogenase